MAVSNTEKFARVNKNLDNVFTGDLISGGPWIGVVKNNVDYTRAGRLQVYIPALGNIDPEDPAGWTICNYLSPYMGFTNMNNPDARKTYDAVQQSYGMWMVPPDVGIRVLVIFAEHDINKAYWIGCIPEPLKTHMTPSIGSREYSGTVNFGADYASDITLESAQQSLTSYFEDNTDPLGIKFPTSEVQFKPELDEEGNPKPGSANIGDFYTKARAIHEDVYKTFLVQGLDRDKDRGPITSSSQRETPSQVFGISTPGRPRKDIAQDENLITKSRANELTEEDVKDYVNKGDKARRGGHSFTMDDGSITGDNNLVRLRTSRGHQITMHDTEEFISIHHATGLAWIEIDPQGQISIFSNNNLNIRTGFDLNLRADRNINIEAGNEIKMRAEKFIRAETDDIEIKSFKNTRMHQGEDLTVLTDGGIAINSKANSGWNCDADTNITAATINLNSGAGPASPSVKEIEKEEYTDVIREDKNIWEEEQEPSIESILEFIPTHEPYPRRNAPKTPLQIANFYKNLL